MKVYITCCKKDYYLAKICIASIRYWNPTIPVFLLKDLSQGEFDTGPAERLFNVGIAATDYPRLFGYIKLQPYYMASPGERILISDADIVWLGDIEAKLKDQSEDLLVDAYTPVNPEEEMNKWYFNTELLRKHYEDYQYPGFLFNAGFYACKPQIFRKEDLGEIIRWKDNPEFLIPGIFLCEDQGIVNYLSAKKKAAGQISIKGLPLQKWGYSEFSERYPLDRLKARDSCPFALHWFGRKYGLTYFLPGAHVLHFYEAYYYSFLRHGRTRMLAERARRTFSHFHYFMYESAKRVYYSFSGKQLLAHSSEDE